MSKHPTPIRIRNLDSSTQFVLSDIQTELEKMDTQKYEDHVVASAKSLIPRILGGKFANMESAQSGLKKLKIALTKIRDQPFNAPGNGRGNAMLNDAVDQLREFYDHDKCKRVFEDVTARATEAGITIAKTSLQL